MKSIKGNPHPNCTDVYYKCGKFTYKMTPDNAKLPDFLEDVAIAGGCCDKDDNVFLFSRDMKHPIIMLDSDFNYVKDFGAGIIGSSHFLYVTPSNTLLCMDAFYHVCRELTMDGEQLRIFGTEGKASDSGYDPNIWIRWRKNGELVPTEYGIDTHVALAEATKTIVRAAEPFNRPTDVYMNSKGEYFFSDGYGNAAVHKFDSNGNYVKTWGGPGREPGKFITPHCIAVDKYDRVWVGDREGSALHIFDGEGNILGHVEGGLYQPSGLWTDDEYVYCIGRGGILTILNMDMEIEAQIGFFNCDLRAHDMCGNSKSELLLFPTYANIDHQVIRLTRVE